MVFRPLHSRALLRGLRRSARREVEERLHSEGRPRHGPSHGFHVESRGVFGSSARWTLEKACLRNESVPCVFLYARGAPVGSWAAQVILIAVSAFQDSTPSTHDPPTQHGSFLLTVSPQVSSRKRHVGRGKGCAPPDFCALAVLCCLAIGCFSHRRHRRCSSAFVLSAPSQKVARLR